MVISRQVVHNLGSGSMSAWEADRRALLWLEQDISVAVHGGAWETDQTIL